MPLKSNALAILYSITCTKIRVPPGQQVEIPAKGLN